MLRRWLPIAAAVTALCLLVYVSVQQSLRSGANDPQIQLAEDAARALERGAMPESVVPANNVSIAESLTAFVIVYDSTLQPLAGSGRYHDRLLAPPPGVFEHARARGQARVTWQPAPALRIATVIVPATTATGAKFVLAGRSLREVEERQMFARNMVAAALLGTLAMTFSLVWLGERFSR